MNRVSVRTKYLGAAPACYGKTGWTHWPVNDANTTGEFHADDGMRAPCNAQDVAVWIGTSVNAT
jgi:hypothetical protein